MSHLKNGGWTNLMVVIDMLSKGVTLEPLKVITAENVAHVFLRTFYRRRGLPAAVISDRGSQYVGMFWLSYS